MKKSIIASFLAATVMFAAVDASAKFGGSRSSSVGISRSSSISKPKTYSSPNFSKPSYSKPAYSSSSKPTSTQPRVVEKHYYNNTPNRGYNNNYGNGGNSFGRDVAATALGVGGGILAAEAIKSLIAGPNGTYTHPQYPGTTFNQQGVPIDPATGQPLTSAPQEQMQSAAPSPQVIVANPQPAERGFFSMLWGALGNVLHLFLFLAVVAGLVFGGYLVYNLLKRKKDDMNMMGLENDLDNEAQDIFYNFQKNASNLEFIERNSKYLNPSDILSPACKVLNYQHNVIDVSREAGKIRASVHYTAVVQPMDTIVGMKNEHVDEIWNFERVGEKWVLVGVEDA